MRMASTCHVCTKIFKPATLKCYVLTECNKYITEDNPEPRTEFWEWFLGNLDTIFKLQAQWYNYQTILHDPLRSSQSYGGGTKFSRISCVMCLSSRGAVKSFYFKMIY